jgi:hypothetical protein
MPEQRKPTSTKSAAAVVPGPKASDPETEKVQKKVESKPEQLARPDVSMCSVCGTHHEGIKHVGE